MNEEVAEIISSLGADGISAFYAYLAVDTLQLLLLSGLMVWGIRTAWPFIKKDL